MAIGGPRLGLVGSLLGPTLLVFLVLGLGLGPGPALCQKVYTNTWAVHIPGGLEVAEWVAGKHGFINHGHVSARVLVSSLPVMN